MKLNFTFYLVFVFCCFYGQERIYLNSFKKKVTSKDSASYYREISEEKNFFRIKDFYINGILQRDGLASSVDKANSEVFGGAVKYYNEEGKITEVKYYKEGKETQDRESYKYISDGEPFNEIHRYIGGVNTTVIYDHDIHSIRSESLNNLIKYYDAQGKLIGSEDNPIDMPQGTIVQYFSHPMRVYSISKYAGRKDSIIEKKMFYSNGVLKSVFTLNKGKIKVKTYNQKGKLINVLNNNSDYDKRYLNGRRISFYNEENEGDDMIRSIETFEKNKLVKMEVFYEDGTKKRLTLFNPKREYFYNKEGNLKFVLRYDSEGNAVDGTRIDKETSVNFREITFKNKKIVSVKYFNKENDALEYHRNYNPYKDSYEVKVFDRYRPGIPTFFYTTKGDGITDYYSNKENFSFNVTSFFQGKLFAQGVVKNSELIEGKIVQVVSNINILIERLGDKFIVKEISDDGSLKDWYETSVGGAEKYRIDEDNFYYF